MATKTVATDTVFSLRFYKEQNFVLSMSRAICIRVAAPRWPLSSDARSAMSSFSHRLLVDSVEKILRRNGKKWH